MFGKQLGSAVEGYALLRIKRTGSSMAIDRDWTMAPPFEVKSTELQQRRNFSLFTYNYNDKVTNVHSVGKMLVDKMLEVSEKKGQLKSELEVANEEVLKLNGCYSPRGVLEAFLLRKCGFTQINDKPKTFKQLFTSVIKDPSVVLKDLKGKPEGKLTKEEKELKELFILFNGLPSFKKGRRKTFVEELLKEFPEYKKDALMKESPGLEEAKIVDLQIEKLIECAKDVWHITSNATHSHNEETDVQINKFVYAQPDRIVQKFTKAVCAAYPTLYS